MKTFQMSGSFVFLILISPAAFAQENAAWERKAAQQEIDGMRRYAWALSEAIAGSLEKSPAEKFPAVHAFLKDFRDARQGVDPQQAPSKWKTIGVESLAIRNPNYWAAVYEVEPAAPLMMWFHATRDSAQQLERLASQLQAAGLNELGLLVRQLAVAHRQNSYNEDDLRFIKTSLRALMPEDDFDAAFKGLGEEKDKLRLDNF